MSNVAPEAFRRAGYKVTELYCEADGSFPHRDPNPAEYKHLGKTGEAVRACGADFGVAFDGDGDRAVFVDEKGRPVNGAIREVNSRAYCSWFNFAGADQQKKVGVLSGGERNRLNLAMMLKQGANVLLLDEPTNDLDVATIRALEDAIEDFAGCALIVSHDRWFLDRVCTHILAFENNSQVMWFEGNWSDYAEWRRKQLGADADRPHKTVYRKMER